MKKQLLFSFLFLFFFTSIAQTNVIDSIKVIPRNISIFDNVLFATFSKPFGGDCTYQLNLDSMIGTKIYISGKFESDAKCMGKGANDTIDIGLLPARTYELVYKFIDIKREDDIVPNVPTETYSIEFVVSPSSKVQDVKSKEFGVSYFPNPVSDFFTISDPKQTVSRVEIFDVFGKKVHSQLHENTVNMSSFSTGLYVLKVYDINGKVSTFKIIKE